MYKVLTLVGTRPEIIKLSLTIKKLDKFFNHYLVHTGQNYDYELNEIFFKDLEIRKPDFFLNSKSKNSITTISKIFVKFNDICEKIKPDAVLILGDTNSALAAIVANKKKIPIFHIEAGNRSFNRDTPEELNRKLIDHSSDINLTYTEIAKDYLMNEGIPGDKIIKVGSPMLEILKYFESKINKTLPRKIDDITELIQLSVNCETTIMKYSKAILVDESLFAEGWKSRKQRQHTQLHCNAAGLTSKEGWTAVDVWFDRDFGYLTTLTTSPTDCN